MTPHEFGAILLFLVITIAVDAVYGFGRMGIAPIERKMHEVSNRVLMVEAGILALSYTAWAFYIGPDVFNVEYIAAGVAVYGILLLVVSFFSLSYGKLLLLPLGYCSIAFVGFLAASRWVLTPIVDWVAGIVPVPLPGLPNEVFIGMSALIFFGTAYLYVRVMSDGETIWDDTNEVPHGPSETTVETSNAHANGGRPSNSGSSSGAGGGQPTPPTAPSGSGLSNSPGVSAADLQQFQYGWHHSSVMFEDIGGYYDVKADLQNQIFGPLKAATDGDDRFARFGIEPERGVMFYGPPGTGKTMFARALAGQLGVPFVELSPGDLTSQWINGSTEQIQLLFDEAQAIGQCVIFIDEAEHLFGARDTANGRAHAEDRKVTSEFLVQLTREDREAIVVSATNRPGDIDPAILRPGRLDTHFEIGLPDDEARHAILDVHLSGVPSTVSGDELAELAAQTEGLTGADLGDLVDDAKRTAAQKNAQTVGRHHFPSVNELKELTAALQPDAESETSDLPDAEPDKAGARGSDPGRAGALDNRDNDRSIGFQ